MEGENRITLMGKPDDQGGHPHSLFLVVRRRLNGVTTSEYVVTMPNMRASGLLFGTLAYELGGQCVVENKPNQLRCPLDFKTRVRISLHCPAGVGLTCTPLPLFCVPRSGLLFLLGANSYRLGASVQSKDRDRDGVRTVESADVIQGIRSPSRRSLFQCVHVSVLVDGFALMFER